MQVLLVNPDAPFLYDARALPPLGILYLGAALEANGFSVAVVDLAKQGSTVEGFDPGMIGISCVTAKFPEMAGIVSTCRRAYPGIPILVGGPHFSICPDDGRKVGADAVGLGDCEDAIVEAAGDVLRTGAFEKTSYASPGWIVDANKFPIPARHLIPLHEYCYMMYDMPTTPIITARGCPYECAFCCHWEGYRKVRFRDSENVVEEIRQLKDLGFHSIIIYDDEFNLRTDRLTDLCRAIEAEKIQFRAIIRSDLLTKDQAEALARAGCVEVSVGVESGSEKILKIIGKRTTPEVNKRCRDLCREHGIRFKAFTIIGLPGETRETVMETKRWLIENRVDEVTVSLYMPYLGTPIVNNPQNYDIQFEAMDYEHTYLAFRGSADADLANVCHTSALSAAELKELRKEVEDDVRAACGLVPQPRREGRKWKADSPSAFSTDGRPLFSICHTTARPNAWRNSYEAWRRNCDSWQDVEYVLCVDERWGFPKDFHEPGITVVWNGKRKCCVDGFNIAAAASTGHVLLVNSDDFFPSEHWDTELKKVIPDLESEYVIEVSTHAGADQARIMTFQILTRARYERVGYLFYPGYESMCCDIEFTERARMDGVVIDARHIVIEHRHYTMGGLPRDAVYAHENRPEAYRLGWAVLEARRAQEFPVREHAHD